MLGEEESYHKLKNNEQLAGSKRSFNSEQENSNDFPTAKFLKPPSKSDISSHLSSPKKPRQSEPQSHTNDRNYLKSHEKQISNKNQQPFVALLNHLKRNNYVNVPVHPPKEGLHVSNAGNDPTRMLRSGFALHNNLAETRPQVSTVHTKKQSFLNDTPAVKFASASQPNKYKAQIAANSVVKNDVHDSNERRNLFLWQHKELFLPFLTKERNFFTKLANNSILNDQHIIGFRSLYEQPASIVGGEMMGYQLHGLSFLLWLHDNGLNGILGDEMGLGKTVQTIALFSYLKSVRKISGPHLVVCPLSVLTSWMNEFKRWDPSLKVCRFHGQQSERMRIKEQLLAEDFHVIVTTYEQIVAESTYFKSRFHFRYVVIDEGHKLKNEKSLISEAATQQRTQYRLLLTGTPLQNDMHELWALLHFLFPEIFTLDTSSCFDNAFNLTRGVINTDVLANAKSLLEKFMIRRLKSQVDLAIPPKEEMTIYVPLSPVQRFWYKRLITRLDQNSYNEIFGPATDKDRSQAPATTKRPDLPIQLNIRKRGRPKGSGTKLATSRAGSVGMPIERHDDEGKDGKSQWQKFMNLVMQLRKCCNHPALFPSAQPGPPFVGEPLVLASSKMVLLDKLLAKLKNDGKQVLIFSQFTTMLDIIEDYMDMRGYTYGRLDGSKSRPRRNLDIGLFQRQNSPYFAFLLSTRAGGLGINLTAADTVIFYDSDWNPQVDIQAMARAHRIGQTKKVSVYRFVCQDTVEERMLLRTQKKLYLSSKVTEQMIDQHLEDSQFSKTELVSMIKFGANAVARMGASYEEFMKENIHDILDRSKKSAKIQEGTEISPDNFDVSIPEIDVRIFEGIRHEASIKDIANELADTVKRQRQSRTVIVDGVEVARDTVDNDQWEAVKTFTGHSHASNKKTRGGRFENEDQCHSCKDGGLIVMCSGCPRSYHPECIGLTESIVQSMSNFYCIQHSCDVCLRNTGDAGGLLFRCQCCPSAFCEDDLPESIEYVGNTIPELVERGYGGQTTCFWIRCPECVAYIKETPESLSPEGAFKAGYGLHTVPLRGDE